MSDFAIHPEDVPAADWAEQQEDADPLRDEDEGASSALRGSRETEADEADLAEQGIQVFYPDDED